MKAIITTKLGGVCKGRFVAINGLAITIEVTEIICAKEAIKIIEHGLYLTELSGGAWQITAPFTSVMDYEILD